MVLCCCRSKTRRRKNSGEVASIEPEEEDNGADNAGFATTGSATAPVPEVADSIIKKEDLVKYITEHQNDLKLYKDEFARLPGAGVKPTTVGKKNASKNRYINIVPFDDNRICLKENASKKDYINASYIDSFTSDGVIADKILCKATPGYKLPQAYIAAQGPMDNTVDDFWQMVWEQNCTRIVMVTNVMEGEKVKCTTYWPKSVDEKDDQQYRNITVKLLKEKESDDKSYVIRTLKIKHGEDTREIHQFHFTGWPDQDVPDTCTSVLKFYKLSFNNSEEYPLTRPLLVHCSAGVGRTGTLIALDYLIQQMKDKKEVDVWKCVENLRLQRVNMVQSTSQYVFLHHALLEQVLLPSVEIKKENFDSKYEEFLKSEEQGRRRVMNHQYEVLDAVKFKLQSYHFGLANMAKNIPKNRSPNILTADDFMARLISSDYDFEGYINAVYVKGFRNRTSEIAYIATQMPMLDTLNDFWGMVYTDSSTAVIILNEISDSSEATESMRRYWPEDGRTMKCGDIEVTNVGEIPSDNIIVINLELTLIQKKNSKKSSKGRPKSITDVPDAKESFEADYTYMNTLPLPSMNVKEKKKVQLIRVIDWPADSSVPKGRSTLLDVYNQVTECRRNNSISGNIVVQCLYGAERSGLMCALMTVLDRLEDEGVVDLFNAVKSARRTRPEFIDNRDQYKHLYHLVSEYLKSKSEREKNEDDIYANATETL